MILVRLLVALSLVGLGASHAFADTSLATYDCNTDFSNLADAGIGDPTHWTNVTGESGHFTSGASSSPANTCVANASGADTANYYTGGVTFDNNQYAQAVITATSTAAGTGPCLIVRAQAGADTYYRNCWSHAASNNVTCTKIVAGSGTDCSGWPRTQSWSDGATVKFTASGTTTTTLKVYLTGSQIGADSTDASSPINNGNPGIGHSTNSTANSMDSLDFGTVAVVGGATSSRMMLMGVGN